MTQAYKTKKDKTISLNLNVYRNMHYIVNNKLKQEFKELIAPQLKWKKYKYPIQITYKLYWKRMSDLDNLQAVVTKYFQDALVEYDCIKDDNFDYIKWNSYEVMWQDKDNPRFEITISRYQNKYAKVHKAINGS